MPLKSGETLWLLREGESYHPLTQGRFEMGRSEDAPIPLSDPLASRRHAELEVTAELVRIRDLGSRNGIQLRGRTLPPNLWVELPESERIQIGTTWLSLVKERVRGRPVTKEARALPRPAKSQVELSTGSAAPYETALAEADRAARVGDLERRMVATDLLLETLAGALRQGFPADHGAVTAAVQHALYLAEQSGPVWIGRVFSLYRAGGVSISIDTLSRVEGLVLERGGLPDLKPLDAYVAWVRERHDPNDARAIALLRQLERLRRLAEGPGRA